MTAMLARTLRLDESDLNVFARPAGEGEWAVSGGFEFSNWGDGDLTGKARQAFAHGFLSLESFGRATFVAVARIEPAELAALEQALAAHFVAVYGAPSIDAALPHAREEIGFMRDLCDDHAPNTLLAVSRELSESGPRERFRAIRAGEARIDQVAKHID